MEHRVFKISGEAFLLEEKDGVYYIQVNEESVCALNNTAYFIYMHAEDLDEDRIFDLLINSIDINTLPSGMTKEDIKEDTIKCLNYLMSNKLIGY